MSDPLAHIADPMLERLSAFLDGDLDARDRVELEQDLSATPELRAALEVMRRSQGLVRQHAGSRAPADFAERVLAAVEREPVPISRARGWRRPMGVPVEIWALAAAAILVVGVGLRAKTMDLGGSAEIHDASPSPASPAPDTKTETKEVKKEAPSKAYATAKPPSQAMVSGDRKGTVALKPSTESTAGTSASDSKSDPPVASLSTSSTSLPGTAGTVVVGETTGWNYQIKTNDQDVIAKLKRIAQKHGATVTSMRDGDDQSQALWVDVPTGQISEFDADLRKVGIVEGHPDMNTLHLGESVRMLLRIQAPSSKRDTIK